MDDTAGKPSPPGPKPSGATHGNHEEVTADLEGDGNHALGDSDQYDVRIRQERSERMNDGDNHFAVAATESDEEVARISEKKAWSAPKLTIHGSVQQLTGDLGGGIADGFEGSEV
jgi:hypothetical protein